MVSLVSHVARVVMYGNMVTLVECMQNWQWENDLHTCHPCIRCLRNGSTVLCNCYTLSVLDTIMATLNLVISSDIKRILKTLAAVDRRTLEAEIVWLSEKEIYNRKIDKAGGMGMDNLRMIYLPEGLTVCPRTYEDSL